MDKHSQQMKNSVRAELGRNQEGLPAPGSPFTYINTPP